MSDVAGAGAWLRRMVWIFGPPLGVFAAIQIIALRQAFGFADLAYGGVFLASIGARWSEGPGIPEAPEAAGTIVGDMNRRRYVATIGLAGLIIWAVAHGGAWLLG